MENLSELNTSAPSASKNSPATSPSGDSAAGESTGKQNYAERKEQQKKIRKAEKEVKECEEKISKLEARIREMDSLLCQPEHAADMELIKEYTSTKKVLDEENDRWLLLSEKLEETQRELM
jgi:ATP-binding cassette subfamily F protein 3